VDGLAFLSIFLKHTCSYFRTEVTSAVGRSAVVFWSMTSYSLAGDYYQSFLETYSEDGSDFSPETVPTIYMTTLCLNPKDATEKLLKILKMPLNEFIYL
jgi:hypothetical protein